MIYVFAFPTCRTTFDTINLGFLFKDSVLICGLSRMYYFRPFWEFEKSKFSCSLLMWQLMWLSALVFRGSFQGSLVTPDNWLIHPILPSSQRYDRTCPTD